MNIAVAVQDDWSGHVTFLPIFPGLLQFLFISFLGKIEKQGFSPVTAGEDGIVYDGGCEDVHAPKGFDGFAPKFLARFWINSR